MVQFVEAIPHLLLRIFAPVLGVCLVAWLIVLFIPFVRKQVRPVFSVSEGRGGRFPPVQWVVLFLVMVACTLFSGKNTHGVQNVGGGHLFQFSPPLVQIVSPQDVSNGWRVAEESGAEIFALPPAGAVTNENWRLRGAHDDAFRIPADGWSYPYTSGITVLSRGELRASIHSHDFPRPFDQDLSIVPYVNWPQLPEGRRESVFWYDATPSNTLLTTWWNAALGRDSSGNLTIGHRRSIRNGRNHREYFILKRCNRKRYRDIKIGDFSPEILIQPVFCLFKNRQICGRFRHGMIVKLQGSQRLSVRSHADQTERRIAGMYIDSHISFTIPQKNMHELQC